MSYQTQKWEAKSRASRQALSSSSEAALKLSSFFGSHAPRSIPWNEGGEGEEAGATTLGWLSFVLSMTYVDKTTKNIQLVSNLLCFYQGICYLSRKTRHLLKASTILIQSAFYFKLDSILYISNSLYLEQYFGLIQLFLTSFKLYLDPHAFPL